MSLWRPELEKHLNSKLLSNWKDVEARFPEALPYWDIQDGSKWLDGRDPVILLTGDFLAVGCGDHPPFGWAFWAEESKKWIFM